ncbi:MAG: hypothetical protein PHE49_06780 [bacterium]|nr:hypothetical protein [bacterium]
MNKKLTEVLPEEWEVISKEDKALIFPVENNEDWLFELCGRYTKGKFEITLCPIRSPDKKHSQLEPLTEDNWQSATDSATRFLEKCLACAATCSSEELTEKVSPAF